SGRTRDAGRPDRSWRIGVPDIDSLTFDGDDAARAAFASAIAAITRLDLDVVPIDVSPLIDCGRLLYDGAFVAERYTAVGRFVDDHPDEVDPVVGRIISASSRHTAADLFDDLARLEGFRRQAERMWGTDGGIDMVVVPSAPRIPTIAEVLAEPIAVNSMLGTYTNFVNLLDQCALAVPVAVGESSPTPSPHATFVGRAWDDAALVDVASRLGPA
ncbi:MAG: amidase family protein, partial [Acidimicrobiales bacterium]